MDKEELNIALEILRTSERHYRLLLDESVDPTFSFYADGTYRYVNNAFAKGVGKPLGEIIGRKIWDVFEKDEADKRFAVVKRVFATGKKEEVEVRVPLPSGDTYYLTTLKPILNDSGVVETVICTSKNITERIFAEKALRKSEEKYRDLVENIK
ncbi:MAG: PAS domain S-box protein, partial [Deltaproteobacteria bacterium]|nr:PAS domain S-box protein [Deltaproteobacteria bacterium]NNK86156.1 PAS domain S-box protein [Desulfobacterales bacterium]